MTMFGTIHKRTAKAKSLQQHNILIKLDKLASNYGL